jgi:hypothetical protein
VGRLSYGEATGVTQTVRNFGSSFGLAALGTVLITVERSNLVTKLEALGLPGAAAHSAASSLSSSRGSSAPSSVPAALAHRVFHAAQVSLAEGMRAVLYGMAVAMAISGVVALVGLRRGIHSAQDRSDEPANTVQDGAGLDRPAPA